jgi:ribosomal protein S18 acetylase RimI-like enzyme
MSVKDRELYVLKDRDRVAGFAIISMQGILSGYLQTMAVAATYRGQGCGAQLMRFVEERIFREKPNVFLFVSSFNTRARRLYESLGYEVIGTVKDFLVKGHDEILMRKTIGPLKQ